MITNDEIIFKNPKIEEMIDENRRFMELSDAEQQHFMKTAAIKQVGETFIGGYWTSFFDAMFLLEQKYWMDMTYETLENLPYVLNSLYKLQTEGYSHSENMEILAKTVAAYLYGLAMNEHGCRLIISEPSALLMNDPSNQPPLWADMISIRTGISRELDFLEPALQALQRGKNTIALSPVIKAYKRATGVDLAQYNLKDILISEEE